MPAAWPAEQVNYLQDNWGVRSVDNIAANLGKTRNAIAIKATRIGLGPFLRGGEYITVNQFFKAIRGTAAHSCTLNSWLQKGFPVKTKKVRDCRFKIIYLNDFWKWAQEYRMYIDFSKFPENALGEEPEWVKEQRKADIAFAKYLKEPWTVREDIQLKAYIKAYKYTYRDISIMMHRTIGAIKRRIHDLNIKEWPLREPPHGIWTSEEIETVIRMYNQGYRPDVIQEYINKSSVAIAGKIERLVKEGRLRKWK